MTDKNNFRPVSVLSGISKVSHKEVPQGSLLSPLLFNILINDMNEAVISSSLRLYADDTTQYTSDCKSSNFTVFTKPRHREAV